MNETLSDHGSETTLVHGPFPESDTAGTARPWRTTRVGSSRRRRSGTRADPTTAPPPPLYIYHGTQEIWIPVEGARKLYAQQCKLGANAAYREVPGEHLSAALIAYPGALDWLEARLDGKPATNECRPS